MTDQEKNEAKDKAKKHYVPANYRRLARRLEWYRERNLVPPITTLEERYDFYRI